MKAWHLPHYGHIEDLVFEEHTPPKCGETEVLVQIKAAALNPADLYLISGKGGGKFMHATSFPIIPGYDFSGVIEQVGDQVRDLKTGQEVFGFQPYAKTSAQGTLTSYISIHPDHVSPKPANVEHAAAAAAATAGCTALQALRDKGNLTAGQHILINGASGGVGSFAVQIAKQAGATVWGTCSANNMAFVRKLGADHVMDYRKTSPGDIDHDFDTILDVAGASSFFVTQSRLKRGGNYITLLPSIKLATGIARSIFSTKRCRFVTVSPNSDDLAQLAVWLTTGKLQSQIALAVPLHDTPRALKMLEQGVQGKVVVLIAP